MAVREIIKIDEARCNGCGECMVNCPEGALQMVDGKARLVKESYCDGLGACIGKCPQDAITLERREADGFDEEAVAAHMAEAKGEEALPCGCPGAAMREMSPAESCCCGAGDEGATSQLSHWPVQLALVPPTAPFLRDADVLLTADCVPFALADFHARFLRGGRPVLVACPKLDDAAAHVAKLRAVLEQSGLRSLTVVRMEVPCCAGLNRIVEKAMAAAGRGVPVEEVIISTDGKGITPGGAAFGKP